MKNEIANRNNLITFMQSKYYILIKDMGECSMGELPLSNLYISESLSSKENLGKTNILSKV